VHAGHQPCANDARKQLQLVADCQSRRGSEPDDQLTLRPPKALGIAQAAGQAAAAEQVGAVAQPTAVTTHIGRKRIEADHDTRAAHIEGGTHELRRSHPIE